MRTRSGVVAIALLLSPITLSAQAPSLRDDVTLKMGDVAVFVLHNMLGLRQDFSDPTVVTYEPNPGIIDIEIFGGTGSVERARELVSKYWEFIRAIHVPYMQRRFGARLDENSFRIMYYQRALNGQVKLILRFVGGQYIMAP